jgi:hypothetical protein
MTDPSPAPTDDSPHKVADDQEEVYFSGSPLLRGDLLALGTHAIMGLVLIAVPFVAGNRWTVPWFVYLVGMLAGLAVIGWPVLMVRCIRYRISNYRIDYERGLLSKHIDTLELWHVEDIKFDQSLLARMLNVGDITVLSHDDTTPRLVLAGVPNPRPLFETLKQRVIAVKRQRGVIKMDTGSMDGVEQLH